VVTPKEYAEMVGEVFGKLDLALAFEPGRFLVAPGGALIASVEYVKESSGHPVVVVDAAMNDLIRPSLYEAFHDIVPVRQPGRNAIPAPANIVGPVCESTDTFAKARGLPPLAEGDLVAFKTAGAYGAVMASTYNTRPLVPEVLVSGERFAVIRPRPGYDALLAQDAIPDWLPGVP
jgi:diaminopimelate decarboxylase